MYKGEEDTAEKMLECKSILLLHSRQKPSDGVSMQAVPNLYDRGPAEAKAKLIDYATFEDETSVLCLSGWACKYVS